MVRILGWALAALVAGRAWAASSTGITVSPASVSFSYQVGSATLPASSKVTVTLPTGTASGTVVQAQASSAPAWLVVTPASGYSPLALTVTANPTGLAPGSYPGSIAISTLPASLSLTIPVTLMVSNPPSSLVVISPSANYTPATSTSNGTLTFAYTTGAPWPAFPATSAATSSEIDVASNGGTIPFTVTVAAATGTGAANAPVWVRVGPLGSTPSGVTTSGVALSGSYVPITVLLDQTTVQALLPGSYGATITIAPTTSGSSPFTISVNLVVSAGPPSLTSIYPVVIVQNPVVDPLITINGQNFFATSVVTIEQQVGGACALNGAPVGTPTQLTATLLSQQVLEATIPHASALLQNPATLCVFVTNPAPPNNPAQAPGGPATFTVLSSTAMAITAVTNAASYLLRSTQVGTDADPVATGQTAVSPGEIVSIFGRNLGPLVAYTVPFTTVVGVQSFRATVPDPANSLNNYRIAFTFWDVTLTPAGNHTVYAPIIMLSNNQINAVVPFELFTLVGTANSSVSVVVWDGASFTNTYPVLAVAEDPGIFTLGGLGTGQGAILNYSANSGSYTINSAKNAASRGSTIVIYVTGMGTLVSPLADGVIASATDVVNDPVQVTIGGQPAVVSYAGAAGGSVAGLIQINTIVPPTISTGATVSLTVAGGTAATARRSQANVTVAVQ
ncbi:MAG TPA: hypothetical protein VIN93_07805 [Bryobacteraceae bacterium]